MHDGVKISADWCKVHQAFFQREPLDNFQKDFERKTCHFTPEKIFTNCPKKKLNLFTLSSVDTDFRKHVHLHTCLIVMLMQLMSYFIFDRGLSLTTCNWQDYYARLTFPPYTRLFGLILIIYTVHSVFDCLQLFQERLSEKMCTRQTRKVIWDMFNTLFLTTVAVEPTFVAFH